MIFDPASQKFKCEFCLSDYTQAQLDELQKAGASDQVYEEAAGAEEAQAAEPAEGYYEEPSGKTVVVYTCPSCGAEVVTDETTAATFCYYCHNPVVLEGRVSGEFLPDKIIPFQFDKDNGFEVSAFVGDKLLNGCLIHPRVAAVDSRRFLLTVIGFTYSGIFRPRIILCSFVRKLRHHF